jgi:hypothetical protein
MPSRTSSESSKNSKDPRTRTGSHREQLAARTTEIRINVYDLLPVSVAERCLGKVIANSIQPGKLSTILWTIGSGLLHSGVVIGNREYAYGGHDRRGLTGVYYTKYAQIYFKVFYSRILITSKAAATTTRRHIQNRGPARFHPS